MSEIKQIVKNYLAANSRQVVRKTTEISHDKAREIYDIIAGDIISDYIPKIEHLDKVINQLIMYFNNKEKYEIDSAGRLTYSITYQANGESKSRVRRYYRSNKKGLLIMGNTGTGKTDMMRAFNRYNGFVNNKMSGVIKAMDNVEMEFEKHGYAALHKYTKPKIYIFDDIGTESVLVAHYKTSIELTVKIISLRYKVWKTYGTPTYFTTNLNGQMLYDRYGERTMERICEMCNIHPVAGINLRPQN